jgi:hypothetical protein
VTTTETTPADLVDEERAGIVEERPTHPVHIAWLCALRETL